MKKYLLLCVYSGVIGFLLPLASLPVSAQELLLTEAEQTWIEEHKLIKVGGELDWGPFDFVNEQGKYSGIANDYLELISRQTGLEFEVRPDSWSNLIQQINEGDIDLLPAIYYSEERGKSYNFSSKYHQVTEYVFAREGSGITSESDLSGMTAAMVSGWATIDTLRQAHPELEILEFGSVDEAVDAVITNKADILFDALGPLSFRLRQKSVTNIHPVFALKDNESSNLFMASRKDMPELASIISKVLDNTDESTKQAILSKWLRSPQEQKFPNNLSKTIYWLLGITLGIFLSLIALHRLSNHFAKHDEGMGLQVGTARFRILILSALSTFISLVVVLGWLALDQIKGKILHDTGSNLENVLITTTQRLDVWITEQASVLSPIVKNPLLIRQTELLLEVDKRQEALLGSEVLKQVRALLNQYQDTLGLGFFIIDKDGISIASRRDSNIGSMNLIAIQRPDFLKRVFDGESVFVPPVYSDVAIGDKSLSASVSLFVAVPITRDDGSVIAALTIRLDPNQGFSRVLQFSRVGESGESYAFDHNGSLMSASRFEDGLREIGLLDAGQSSIMNIQIRDPGGDLTQGFQTSIPRAEQPLTHMAASAASEFGLFGAIRKTPDTGLTGVQKDTQGYRDYRGVPVFGAWLWDEKLGLGLTSEIDVDEALSTFNTIRTLAMAVLGGTLLLSLGGTLFMLLSGERTNRVLHKAKGELESRVEERTRDLSKANEETSLILNNATDGPLHHHSL